ncbi:ricin-type beta-trefoil lectin domain protein [Actinoplanes sp. NPDC049265]|uniref:ricin-type beta-trefoil lectin domain protein n=1 Tax=Actinoplanes sp. NPDC049265 TaxID=3363902 RepID=UPI00371A81F2
MGRLIGAMTDQAQGDPGAPLLVRRYLHSPVRGGAATRTDVRWPAGEYPSAAATAEAPLTPSTPTVYGTPRRRRHPVALAAAGAVAAAGLAAAGYVVFAPDDSSERAPAQAGALPLVAPSASPSAGSVAEPENAFGGEPTAAPTSTSTSTPAGRRTATPAGEKPARKATRVPAPEKAATTSAPAGARSPLLLAPPAPQRVASRTGRITADDGRCLDLFANNPADGNRIQVFTCNNTPAQSFTLATDGTLRVRDKCADVSRMATVRVTGCGDRGVTRWQVGGNGTLTSASSGNCLTRPPAGRSSVWVVRCSGSAAQRWQLPG